jgi:hypothetical protein
VADPILPKQRKNVDLEGEIKRLKMLRHRQPQNKKLNYFLASTLLCQGK